MKFSHEVESVKRLSCYDDLNKRRGSFPAMVFEFQPRGGGGFNFDGGGPARRRPGFSQLAREVLRSDASRTFGLETAVLGFVTLVSLWPVGIMIHEVIRLLR